MFAIYAARAAPDDPLSALEIGEQPEPHTAGGWVRVKISHASLNRHDLFTLRGVTAHPEGISFVVHEIRFAAGADSARARIIGRHVHGAHSTRPRGRI